MIGALALMMGGVKMNIQKLDRSKFMTNHVLYVLKSDDLGGLYYIGCHSCLGTSYNCSNTKCHYRGSSSTITDLVALHPEARWVMTALAYASDREELKTLEEMHLALHVGHPKCLNIKTSGQSMPKYTPEAKERMRLAARSKGYRMKKQNGEDVFVKKQHLRSAILAGYSFKRINIKIKSYEHKVQAFVGTGSLTQVLIELLDQGWEIGEDRRLTMINAAEFWSLVGYKVEQQTRFVVVPV
jgi:hypothetical protein